MVLHVILTILKAAGILLLVLVLLVLALLLAVLFAPIRYRLSAVFTDTEKSEEVKISWLLHLISVSAFAELPPSSGPAGTAEDAFGPGTGENPLSSLANLHAGVRIRILGIDPAAVRVYLEERKKNKAGKKRAKHRQMGQTGKRGRNMRGKEKRPDQTEVRRQAKGGGQREPNSPDKGSSQTIEHRQTERSGRPEPRGQEKQTDQTEERRQTSRAGYAGRTEQDKRENPTILEEPEKQNSGKFKSFLYKLRGVCDKIRQIPDFVKSILRKIRAVLRKPEQIKKKVSRFLRKLEKYEAADVVSDCWAQLKRMLRHYRVRKGSGYLRFGTGDPALTGELTGVLYLLIPISCGDLEIEPQFTDAIFETELAIRGHIRLIHLVRIAWWAFRNKKLRRLIHAFRK